MGIFDLLKGEGKSIDEYAAEAVEKGYRLIDVREQREFARGHIPGATNVPLGTVSVLADQITNKDEPLYVYCLSGNRSSKACAQLKSLGFTNVTNIGGINSYRGIKE